MKMNGMLLDDNVSGDVLCLHRKCLNFYIILFSQAVERGFVGGRRSTKGE